MKSVRKRIEGIGSFCASLLAFKPNGCKFRTTSSCTGDRSAPAAVIKSASTRAPTESDLPITVFAAVLPVLLNALRELQTTKDLVDIQQFPLA